MIPTENCEKENVQKYKDEIKELQELIPEMNSKVSVTLKINYFVYRFKFLKPKRLMAFFKKNFHQKIPCNEALRIGSDQTLKCYYIKLEIFVLRFYLYVVKIYFRFNSSLTRMTLLSFISYQIEDTKMEAKDMEKVKEMAKEMLGLSGTTKVRYIKLLPCLFTEFKGVYCPCFSFLEYFVFSFTNILKWFLKN